MTVYLRWFERLTFVIIVVSGVGGAIASVVAVATGNWAVLPRSVAVTLALVFIVVVRRRSKAAASSDGVAGMRSLLATFAVSLVLFGNVLATMQNLPSGGVLPWVPVLGAMTVYTVVAPRFAERPLDCTSPTTLAGAYRTRFFLRLAFATTPALFAFTFVFIGSPIWTYFLGAAFSLFRYATYVAPTRAALARDQAALDASGCGLSLVAALGGSAAT